MFSRVPDNETSYVLIKLQPNADVDDVVEKLRKQLPLVDVWSRDEWSNRTRMYWMVTTGAGAALLLAAALGLVVGIVIVGQTLYASTVDRIAEYATPRHGCAQQVSLFGNTETGAFFSGTGLYFRHHHHLACIVAQPVGQRTDHAAVVGRADCRRANGVDVSWWRRGFNPPRSGA